MMRRSLALLALLTINVACDGEGRGGVGISSSILPASKLGFTVQPSGAIVGTPIAPAIQVAIQNASGTTIPTFQATVTLTLTQGTGTSGAILTGTVAAASINGIAAFNNVRVSQPGTGYTITASAPGLVLATSSAFNITP